MRLATIQTREGARAAALREDGFVDLHATDRRIPPDVKSILEGGVELLRLVEETIPRGRPIPPEEARLLPPVPNPEKIICVGANYADHAAESGVPVPPEPIIFCKFLTALCAPEQPIVLPRVSQEVDYEAELVVIIGKTGRYIPEEKASQYIAGYTCGNDISAGIGNFASREISGCWASRSILLPPADRCSSPGTNFPTLCDYRSSSD
jgi:2-keto-4-pentenoate hydratase/2-oxohepta-3-ene-1,7-dioic acid hydratase in catechol pathway